MPAPRTLHFAELLRAPGLNILGRSNAPEYAIAGTTENALYGNSSTPWRADFAGFDLASRGVPSRSNVDSLVAAAGMSEATRCTVGLIVTT